MVRREPELHQCRQLVDGQGATAMVATVLGSLQGTAIEVGFNERWATANPAFATQFASRAEGAWALFTGGLVMSLLYGALFGGAALAILAWRRRPPR